MLWAIAANFFKGEGDRWLDDFIQSDDLDFVKIPPIEQHDWHGGGDQTALWQWYQHLRHARATIARKPDGIITCFPQLAFCIALLKRLGLTRAPVVAHNFNLGSARGKMRGLVAGRILGAIDRFLVHSPVEVDLYANWLGLPRDRFEFVPLQRGDTAGVPPSEPPAPYVIAMGSAHRDYETLVEAARHLGLPVKIVCKASIAQNLNPPENVEVLSNLSREDCWTLLAGAVLSVTPISNLQTASGQITFIDAMRLGIPVLATRCPGTDGYVSHMETGILLKPFDVEDMTQWLERSWQDEDLRTQLSTAAQAFYHDNLSDQAAAARLCHVLGSLKKT